MKNNKGFTLIEILAVITIMAIIMMAAVPAISKLMNNARKDTFAETASKILSAVKTKYTSDDIVCYTSPTDAGTNALEINSGTIYLAFGSVAASKKIDLNDLMDGGATSSFGKTDLTGFVSIDLYKQSQVYKIALADTNNHTLNDGTNCVLSKSQLKRENVKAEKTTGLCTAAKLDNSLSSTGTTIYCTIK